MFTITLSTETKAEVSFRTKVLVFMYMYYILFIIVSSLLNNKIKNKIHMTIDLCLKTVTLQNKFQLSTFHVFESDKGSSSIDFDALYVAATRLSFRLKVNHKLAFGRSLWKSRDHNLCAFHADFLHCAKITECLKTCFFTI